MAEGTVNSEAAPAVSEAASGEIKPSIPGMPQELFDTLRQRHSLETIQQQRAKHKTHEAFLADAEKEAEYIRTVLANAKLSEEERFEGAGKLLGSPLSEAQKAALKRMHEVGKERAEAGVFNYTSKELGQKIKEGREAFTKEQWKALIRAGYAGRLPPGFFTRPDVDPDSYDDPLIKKVMIQVQQIGNAGNADETFLDRMSAYIESANLKEEANADQALRALNELQQLSAYAKYPESRPRPPEDILYRDAVKEKIEKETATGSFIRAKAEYEHYASINVNTLTQNLQEAQFLQTELDKRMAKLATDITTFVEEAKGLGILDDVMTKSLKFYNNVKRARRLEKYGMDKQHIIDAARGRGGYDELFWTKSSEMLQLMEKYRGVAEYVWEGIVEEAAREANGISGDEKNLNVVAKEYFKDLKERRSAERAQEKKYDTFMYYGQRNYELIAEKAEELPQAVLDYVVHKITELSRNPQSAHQKAQQLGPGALEMLETNRDFLVSTEHQDIPNNHPDYLRARYIAESVVGTLVTELMLYKGNVEAANSYRAEFANEFIAHHDEIYLENPYVAYMLNLLTTHRDGTYWLGQPLNTEKIEDGDIEKYRAMIEKEIKKLALNHTLFISDKDFKKRKMTKVNADVDEFLRSKDTKEVTCDLSYSFDDPIERLLLDPDGSVWAATEQRLKAKGVAQADIDAAKDRHDSRVKIFRDIKERNDQEEGLGLTPQEGLQLAQRRQQEEAQLGRSWTLKEQSDAIDGFREEKIRKRILQEILTNCNDAELDFAELSQAFTARLTELANQGQRSSTKYDEVMWKWVEEYNKYLAEMNITGSTNVLADPKWYPSGWDFIRMKIDRPTKVLNRRLLAEEFEAMFEPINLCAEYDKSKTAIKKRRDEARFAFQLARSYQVMWMQDAMLGGMRTRLIDKNTGKYTGRLMDDETSLLLGLIKERIDPSTGQPVMVNGQKVYDVVDPDRKIIRVIDIVQARLEAAIKAEAKEIEDAKANKEAAINSGNLQQIETTTKELRELLVNAQFLATHALKAKGLIEGKWPAWPQNMLDDSSLPVFMNALADYGVETAENIPISHEDKGLFYEIVERGRRGLKAEWDRVVDEHMETSYEVIAVEVDPATGKAKIDPSTGEPVLKKDPQTGELVQATSLWRAAGGFEGKKGAKMKSRYRMVNKGGNDQNRKVVDPRFEASTSGGVRVPELIPEQTDIGLYTLLIWEAVNDIRELHGYIHRQDEVEFYRRHKYFHVKDPVNFVESLAAAYPALNGFFGGKVGDKNPPGMGQEPIHGGFKTADYLIDQFEFAKKHGMVTLIQYLSLMQNYRNEGHPYSQFIDEYSGEIKYEIQQIDPKKDIAEDKDFKKNRKGSDLERYRQMSYLDLAKLTKKEQDELYQTLYGVYDFFQDHLKGLRPVQTSRRGKAPRNWEEDCNKKFYDFRRKIRAAVMGKKENGVWITKPEAGFILRRGYSPEVASEIALKMLETVMREADYIILEADEVDRRVKDGEDLLIAAFDAEDIQKGFEAKDSSGQVTRTWVIPDQKDWPKVVKPEVRKALEKIRRRGLLDFMIEEGYKIEGREILGQKVPPLVQIEMVKQDPNKIMNAFDPGGTLHYSYTQE